MGSRSSASQTLLWWGLPTCVPKTRTIGESPIAITSCDSPCSQDSRGHGFCLNHDRGAKSPSCWNASPSGNRSATHRPRTRFDLWHVLERERTTGLLPGATLHLAVPAVKCIRVGGRGTDRAVHPRDGSTRPVSSLLSRRRRTGSWPCMAETRDTGQAGRLCVQRHRAVPNAP